MGVVMFEFIRGERGSRTTLFKIGNATVPAVLVTRLLKRLENETPRAQERLFIAALAKNYEAVLDELQREEVSIPDAIQALRQFSVKKRPAGLRAVSMANRLAPTVAKAFSGATAKDVVNAFMARVQSPGFADLLVSEVKALEAKNGRNSVGRIRVRSPRPGGNAQAAQMRKARSSKKSKKG